MQRDPTDIVRTIRERAAARVEQSKDAIARSKLTLGGARQRLDAARKLTAGDDFAEAEPDPIKPSDW